MRTRQISVVKKPANLEIPPVISMFVYPLSSSLRQVRRVETHVARAAEPENGLLERQLSPGLPRTFLFLGGKAVFLDEINP